MIDALFLKFFNMLDPEKQKLFEAWIVAVADEISRIALDLEDEELIETILSDKSFNTDLFGDHNDTLIKMYEDDVDIEKAAYDILHIMVQNKEKDDESEIG